MKIRVICVFLFLLAMAWGQARLPLAPPYPAPDARYKADILVVVAHPDDETMVAGYLARAIDQGKRVAVVFCTRGQSGGNMVGAEQGLALAMVRTMEARRAMAALGIHNVWFLSGRDTPGNGDPLHSLESWGHGQVLEEVVRAIRLTRPEVVITWLPDYVVGENHNDHQASAIITTEAFDLAGDRTAFPEQLEPAENRFGFANLDEGLHPWQAQKLYYFSDATHTGFLQGWGPQFANHGISPKRHVSYATLELRSAAQYLTQEGVGLAAAAALRQHTAYAQLPDVVRWNRLVLAKSWVGHACPARYAPGCTAPVFAGVRAGRIAFHPAPGYRPLDRRGLSLRLGDPWAFYHRFWRAHGITQLFRLLRPERGVSPGQTFHTALILHNGAAIPVTATVQAQLPGGWSALAGDARYRLAPGENDPIEAVVKIPAGAARGWQPIGWTAASAGAPAGSNRLQVRLRLDVR